MGIIASDKVKPNSCILFIYILAERRALMCASFCSFNALTRVDYEQYFVEILCVNYNRHFI